MDTKVELEDLMRRERRYWVGIDELVDKMNDKKCPDLEDDFRRLKFLLRKVKNTDDYEFHFNELCSVTAQGTVHELKAENNQTETPATNENAEKIPTMDLTVQNPTETAEKTSPKPIEKATKRKKKYVREFMTSESESEMITIPKPKRAKKEKAKRGRPKKIKTPVPRDSIEEIPNDEQNDENTGPASPKRKISLRRLSKGTPIARGAQINESIYEIAKEILYSQQAESPASEKLQKKPGRPKGTTAMSVTAENPASENVKRKRGRPKGSRTRPNSFTPMIKSKRLSELQNKKEKKPNEKDEAQPEKEQKQIRSSNFETELSDDDTPILDIITRDMDKDEEIPAS